MSLNSKKSTNLTGGVSDIIEKCKARGISVHCGDLTQAIANFTSSVQEPFITQLVDNIQARFSDSDTNLMASFSYIFDPGNYTSPSVELLCQHVEVVNSSQFP